jgi:hypothetical protein
MRPTNAVGAVQVTEIRQLESDVHGQELAGEAIDVDRSPRFKRPGVTPLAQPRTI